MKRDEERLLHMVYAGLFAALTAFMTALLHIPVGSGYIHCGDAAIYLAAAFLPAPYAACAGAAGGLIADVLSGYPAYALPTFLIKGIMALVFSLVCAKRRETGRKLLALVLCGLVTVLGYWLTAVVMYGGWLAQFWATVPANCVQAVGSAVVYLLCAAALEKIQKQHLPAL